MFMCVPKVSNVANWKSNLPHILTVTLLKIKSASAGKTLDTQCSCSYSAVSA